MKEYQHLIGTIIIAVAIIVAAIINYKNNSPGFI